MKLMNPRHVVDQFLKSQVLINIFGTDLIVVERPLVIVYLGSPGSPPQAASDVLDEGDIHAEWLHSRYKTHSSSCGTKEDRYRPRGSRQGG